MADVTSHPMEQVDRLPEIRTQPVPEMFLSEMGNGKPLAVMQFQNEEDGEFYNVWRVDYPDQIAVLKQAKGNELDIYRTFFSGNCAYAPQLYGNIRVGNSDYLLMEYIPGNSMMRCTRQDLTLVLNSLIAMQKAHWGAADSDIPQNRIDRKHYLMDDRLEKAYDAYLQEFKRMPRTLCHDDLLPFNVVISGDRAVFIDWEVGGMLPYPTSLARLIAHGQEDKTAFFYMRNDDKYFAIDYFYEHFVKDMGIERSSYNRDIALCLLYEYCEWVFVGHKYNATDSERFQLYCKLAITQAEKMGF